MKYPRPRAAELRHILENFPEPLRVLDEQGQTLFCNPLAADGFAPDSVVLKCTWQGRPAQLEVARDARELEAELERAREQLEDLKRTQRRTARRKRRAEKQLDLFQARSRRATQQAEQLRDQVRKLKSEPSQEVAARLRQLEAELEEARSQPRADPDAAARLVQLEHELDQARSRPQSDPEVERLAYEDTLTGLPNANILRRYLDFSLKQSARYSRVCAVLYLDLDEFRVVNETMGYEGGDELLRGVAGRLRACLRDSDVVSRKAEDEFLVLLAELPGAEATEAVELAVARIREAMAVPFTIQGHDFAPTVSLGVGLYPAGAGSADALIRAAETAMYRAKTLGGDAVEFFSEELERRSRRRFALESHLRSAVREREFFAAYQPVVHTASGKVVGAEVLMRWRHRTAGVLLASDFLEAAEETGLIVPIGYQVAKDAATHLQEWRRHGLHPLISLNLSGRQLLEPNLGSRLAKLLADRGLEPGAFTLELRENGAVRSSRRWVKSLERLEEAGFGFCLDDFGGEESRLATLARPSVGMVKMHPRLTGRRDRIAQILPMGVGVSCVAKNVEEKLDLVALSELGFEMVQGRAVGEPLEEEAMGRLLGMP